MPNDPNVFRLKRYFSLVSLIGIVAVVAGLSWFYRDIAQSALVRHQTEANVTLATTVANAVWAMHGDFVAQTRVLPPEELLTHGAVRDIDRHVRRLLQGLNVLKVKIFSPSGLTVYSTDADQIGDDASSSMGFQTARDGAIASELNFKDEYYALEGYVVDRDVVTSYVPIRDRADGSVTAVVEVYSDVTSLAAQNMRTQWQVTLVVLASLLALYLFLLLIVGRADRMLRAQEQRRLDDAERIRHQAFHDMLTGLPNRASFLERLEDATARAKRSGASFAVMFLDLDRFKVVNDSLGHAMGDRLLQVVAKRLGEAVRETDMVFRMGGDEFTVIAEGLDHPEDGAAVARRVLHALEVPVALGDHELSAHPSIGIATYPLDATTPEVLVKSADTAMYHAKELGGKRFQFFAADMDLAATRRLEMETALQRALQNREFELYYQPKVRAGGAEVVGMEALLRWHHPSGEIIGPDQFIPYLEESGLIVPVGEWVTREACRQNKAWQDAGLPALRVSVNVSAAQFRSELFPQLIREALRSSGLEPRFLELELTESLLVDNVNAATQRMRELKQIGVVLSLDDFGTGYSSLSYLKDFPLDYLKVDRSFLASLENECNDSAIVRSIASLAHALHLGIVAEGVERPEQVKCLHEYGYDEMQGFLFSQPVPAAELAEFLRNRTRHTAQDDQQGPSSPSGSRDVSR